MSFLMRTSSRAWMLMSTACPETPPQGWWMRIREEGSATRLPWAPQARRSAPMEAACPRQMVCTSGLMYWMVS